MDDAAEVWRLRRDLTRHPARRSAQSATLGHRAVVVWASRQLAVALGLPGAGRPPYCHLFHGGRAHGGQALTELAEAAPLVDAVDQILARDYEPARLGAFGLGMPCCPAHQEPVLDRLADSIAADTGHRAEAESNAAALAVLRAQIVLYDAALTTIRRRTMAVHPSVWRPAQTRLLPAG